MEKQTSFTVAFFEKQSSFAALFPALLTAAGYRVLCYSTETLSLAAFLKSLLQDLKQEQASPCDLVLLVVSAEELEGQTCAILKQLVSCELLPVILLTATPFLDQPPFLTNVVLTPFFSRYVFRPYDLEKAWETATGVSFPLSEAIAKLLSQWLCKQMQEAIQAHQRWLDLRQQWLGQREAWINRRQAWLDEQCVWIEQQRQHPEVQDAWLNEQQAWIDTQQDETTQQKRRLSYEQHWLTQQQHKFMVFKKAILS